MNSNKKYAILFFLIIIIIITLMNYHNAPKKRLLIKEDMQMVIGKIEVVSMSYRGGVLIYYSFIDKNHIYKNQKTLSLYSGTRGFFLNKSFPVVFSSKSPEINQMLILPKDFERYNMQYPDSLLWVKKLLDKSW